MESGCLVLVVICIGVKFVQYIGAWKSYTVVCLCASSCVYLCVHVYVCLY